MNHLRNFSVWVVLVLLLLALFTFFGGPVPVRSPPSEVSYSLLLIEIDHDRVRDVVIQGHEIRGTYVDDRRFYANVPDEEGLIERLNKHKVRITDKNAPWYVSLLPWLSIIAFGGVITLFRRSSFRNFGLWAITVLSLFAMLMLFGN